MKCYHKEEMIRLPEAFDAASHEKTLFHLLCFVTTMHAERYNIEYFNRQAYIHTHAYIHLIR